MLSLRSFSQFLVLQKFVIQSRIHFNDGSVLLALPVEVPQTFNPVPRKIGKKEKSEALEFCFVSAMASLQLWAMYYDVIRTCSGLKQLWQEWNIKVPSSNFRSGTDLQKASASAHVARMLAWHVALVPKDPLNSNFESFSKKPTKEFRISLEVLYHFEAKPRHSVDLKTQNPRVFDVSWSVRSTKVTPGEFKRFIDPIQHRAVQNGWHVGGQNHRHIGGLCSSVVQEHGKCLIFVLNFSQVNRKLMCLLEDKKLTFEHLGLTNSYTFNAMSRLI